jgi:hypothetical protein
VLKENGSPRDPTLYLFDDTLPTPPPPEFELPVIPTLPKVKTSALVTKWLNIRALPKTTSADLGDVRPGEIWEVFGHYTEANGNVWFALKKDLVVGWCAALYAGEAWLQLVK